MSSPTNDDLSGETESADGAPLTRPHLVKANSRRQAIAKLLAKNPALRELYDEGPNRDGRGGWINAIKDQRTSAYRLIFYLHRLPLGPDHQDREHYEVLFAPIGESEQNNYPRILFTMTGAVNLIPSAVLEKKFTVGVKTDCIEIVPVPMNRDFRVAPLLKDGFTYICLYDSTVDALRILDLNNWSEIYTVEQRREVQVRTSDEMVVGDSTFVRPFFLKLRKRQFRNRAASPSDAANQMLQ